MSPARTSEALARRSEAITVVPSSAEGPRTTALAANQSKYAASITIRFGALLMEDLGVRST